MLYIIGGTSRGGKSTISRSILNNSKIPYLSLDWLVAGFTNGLPEYGINDKLFPDDIAKRMWDFSRAMLENLIWVGKDYVVEGEAILPVHINELTKKHPDKVKACFVGYTEIDVNQKLSDIKKFSEGSSDWLSNETDEYIISHINNMLAFSRMIKMECEKYQIKYFDTSHNFIEAIGEAETYLYK